MNPAGSAVVVDTNILFSALLRADSTFAQVLFQQGREFFVCETTYIELFRLRRS